MKADHKNHQEIHEAFKGSNFEDKLALAWGRYKKHAFLLVLFVVLVMLGFQGVSYFKRAQIRALQEEYQDAEDEFHELVFAEKNPREPLSGLVFLNAGDRAYNEGQFEESKGYYEKALVPLKKTPLNGRAQMALALGAYRAGHVDQAEAKLNAILNEKSFLASVRAEAGYQLALLALESGDENRAQEYLASVSKLPSTGVWAQKAILLAGLIPEVMG